MTSQHQHQTILRGAAEELLRTGRIETFDAVYRWVCPDCGMPQRTTRLADTVYALRHAYGWQIDTEQPDKDNLAAYVLVKRGDMPGESNGPHPRKLVRDHIDELDSRTDVQLESSSATGYSAYDGKRVPVEAIPVTGRWECTACGFEATTPVGQPQLGGYRLAHCPSKECRDIKKPRIWRPVK